MTKNIFIVPVISSIVMVWPGIAAAQSTVFPVASAVTKTPTVLYEQKFDWDDALDSGQYVWGQDGFLKMDGSQGKIQCSHRLKESITDGTSKLTFSAIFVLGRSYRIILYDSLHEPVATVDIQRDGQIVFGANSSREVDSGANIACSPGKPCNSPGREQSMARATPLQVLKFSDVNFKSGTFDFSIDAQKYSNIPLKRSSSNVSSVEIQTLSVEPGSIIWLKSFRQERDQHKIIEDEQFTSYWTSNTAVTPGYPADKWQATSYKWDGPVPANSDLPANFRKQTKVVVGVSGSYG